MFSPACLRTYQLSLIWPLLGRIDQFRACTRRFVFVRRRAVEYRRKCCCSSFKAGTRVGNFSSLVRSHGQRDGENAPNDRTRMIPGCQHVFPQDRRTACEVFYSGLGRSTLRRTGAEHSFEPLRSLVAATPTFVARRLGITNIKAFSTIAQRIDRSNARS
jgi:hypothetical protein